MITSFYTRKSYRFAKICFYFAECYEVGGNPEQSKKMYKNCLKRLLDWEEQEKKIDSVKRKSIVAKANESLEVLISTTRTKLV